MLDLLIASVWVVGIADDRCIAHTTTPHSPSSFSGVFSLFYRSGGVHSIESFDKRMGSTSPPYLGITGSRKLTSRLASSRYHCKTGAPRSRSSGTILLTWRCKKKALRSPPLMQLLTLESQRAGQILLLP